MIIDSFRFLDFASRQMINAWVNREAPGTCPVPWTLMANPLAACKVALITTAGVARRDDVPFDEV